MPHRRENLDFFFFFFLLDVVNGEVSIKYNRQKQASKDRQGGGCNNDYYSCRASVGCVGEACV